jgi:hypothetical protein
MRYFGSAGHKQSVANFRNGWFILTLEGDL